MADELGQLKGSLATAETGLGAYTKDLPGQIEGQIKEAWTPSMKESVGETQRQMGEFLPKYWQMPETLGGTTAADLSPTQKLGVMGKELGTMGGRLSASSRLSDYLGAQARDLYGKAKEAMQMGYQSAADAYSRKFQQYNLAWQAAEQAKQRALQISESQKQRSFQAGESAKDRALSRALAASRGGGGGGDGGLSAAVAAMMSGTLGGGTETGGGNMDAQRRAWGQLGTIPRVGIGKGISAEKRYDLAQRAFTQHGIQPSFAAYKQAGYSDRMNPMRR